MQHLLLILVVALPLSGAIGVAAFRPHPDLAGRIVTRTVGLGLLAAIVLLGVTVVDGEVGSAALAADRATAVLAVLTSGVGALVVSYARRALAGDPRERRWYLWTSLLMAATSTTVLAGSGLALLVGWVSTSVAVVALVGHRSEWAAARRSSRRVAAALAVGDLALIGAVGLVAVTVGTLDLREPSTTGADLAGQGWPLTAVAVLIVVAGVSRSALVPLHRWLPSTLVAPTPVSALLHAGVVNGAGVLLIKTAPLTGASTFAMALLFAAGAATTLVATAVMLVRADVKGKLAWSTAGQMGFMAIQLAIGALGAALFHIVGHALYKASLFLGSGGAVQAGLVERRLPTATIPARRWTVAGSAVLAAAATVGALMVFDPSGPAAATLLVGLFGWVMVARLVQGWLGAVDEPRLAVPAALAGAVMLPFAYVGGVSGFKSFVDGPALAAGAGAIGLFPLIAALSVVTLGVALVAWLPGRRGRDLRRRTAAALIGVGTPPLAEQRIHTAPVRPALRLVARSGGRTPDTLDDPVDITWRSTA